VARWRSSGLSAKEFASELGVSAGTLHHWAWRLGREARPSKCDAAPALQVVEVVRAPVEGPAPSGEPYEVITPTGWRVRVPVEFDAASLRRLLAAVAA
jgi:hypothetical protein